jgi:hypothetical protein
MMDLKPYVGRTVLLQLKQPYMLKMARAERGVPVPLHVVQDKNGIRLAQAGDTENVQPLSVDILVGEIKERGGRIFVQFKDQTSDAKIEVELASELVFAVTAVSEDRILIS